MMRVRAGSSHVVATSRRKLWSRRSHQRASLRVIRSAVSEVVGGNAEGGVAVAGGALGRRLRRACVRRSTPVSSSSC